MERWADIRAAPNPLGHKKPGEIDQINPAMSLTTVTRTETRPRRPIRGVGI
jgi:hypothetical protein